MTRSLLTLTSSLALALAFAGSASAGTIDPDDLTSSCYAVWEDVTPQNLGIEVCSPVG
jgi:hypothetical protein